MTFTIGLDDPSIREYYRSRIEESAQEPYDSYIGWLWHVGEEFWTAAGLHLAVQSEVWRIRNESRNSGHHLPETIVTKTIPKERSGYYLDDTGEWREKKS